MKRVVIAVLGICAIGAFVYWQGGKDTRDRVNETKLIREKGISDAIKDTDASPAWRDELRDRGK